MKKALSPAAILCPDATASPARHVVRPAAGGDGALGDARLPVAVCLRRPGDASPRRSSRPWRVGSTWDRATRGVRRLLRTSTRGGAGDHARRVQHDGSRLGGRSQLRGLWGAERRRPNSSGRKRTRSSGRSDSILRPSYLIPVSIALGIRVLRAPVIRPSPRLAGPALYPCLWST